MAVEAAGAVAAEIATVELEGIVVEVVAVAVAIATAAGAAAAAAALNLSHNQNRVLKWSTQNHAKKLRRRPRLFMVGIVPY